MSAMLTSCENRWMGLPGNSSRRNARAVEPRSRLARIHQGWLPSEIQWESNAYSCFPQEATRRTEPPTLNYTKALDSTRWTVARGVLNRVSEVRVLPGAPIF